MRKVLVEYNKHLPLSCRQVFYRLVAMCGFDKTEGSYGRLCEAIGRARRAGLISFDVIRDDGTSRYEAVTWDDAEDFLSAVRDDARSLRLDRQEGQLVRLWVLCEAGGMAPMLARVANPYGVPVLTSGGARWQALSYCTTRKALARLWTEFTGETAPENARLPERVRRARHG